MNGRLDEKKVKAAALLILCVAGWIFYRSMRGHGEEAQTRQQYVTQTAQPPPHMETPAYPEPPPMPQPIVQQPQPQRQEWGYQRPHREPRVNPPPPMPREPRVDLRKQERAEAVKTPSRLQLQERVTAGAPNTLEIVKAGEGLQGANPFEVPGMRYPASTDYVLPQGRGIPAVLVNALDSQVNCEAIAEVTADVYDYHNRFLLIPARSQLHGKCGQDVGFGQFRLPITWDRVRYCDNSSLPLPKAYAADMRGNGGLKASVNRHIAENLQTGLLLTLVGAGIQLGQNRGQYGSAFDSYSAGNVIGNAAANEFGQIARRSTQRGLDIPPTLTLSEGTPLLVLVQHDIAFTAPWSGQCNKSVASDGE